MMIAGGVGHPGCVVTSPGPSFPMRRVGTLLRSAPCVICALDRQSPDDSETGVESSDFAASLEARREMWLATSRSGSPNDGRGVDLAIFTGIWTHSSCRLRLNA